MREKMLNKKVIVQTLRKVGNKNARLKTVKSVIGILKIVIICLLCCPTLCVAGSIYVTKPEIMKTWEGFFDPQIEIHSAGKSMILRPNECQYLFPTIFIAYIDRCDAQANATESGDFDCVCVTGSSGCFAGKKGYDHYVQYYGESTKDICNWKTYPNKNIYGYNEMCFDIFREEATVVGVAYYGCINIPLAAPPPPFCQRFEASPEVRIVPDVTATALAPKIKILIGTNASKQCANGAQIPVNANCTDGSAGKSITATTRVLEPKRDGSESVYNVEHSRKQYTFKAMVKADEVCAYFVDPALRSSKKPICYKLPTFAKPTNLRMRGANTIEFEVPGYNGGPLNVQVGNTNAQTSLSAFRPEINEKREFLGTVVCKNAEGNTQDVSSNANGYYCNDSGYQPTIDYKEDGSSKVVCIKGWNSDPATLALNRNGQKQLISETPYGFVPYKADINSGDLTRDDDSYPILISRSTQETMDTISNAGRGRFLIQTSQISSPRTYLYEQIGIPMNQALDAGSITTFFQNYKDASPVLLNQAETMNKDYAYLRPIDPYLLSLCVHPFQSIEYTDPAEEHFFSVDDKVNKCEFLTMEAWGAGGSGHVFDVDDPAQKALISEHGEYLSGASGGYLYTTLNIKNSAKKILKLQIGKGAASASQKGGITSVSLCSAVEETTEAPATNTPPGQPQTPPKTRFTGKDCAVLFTLKGAGIYGAAANLTEPTQDQTVIFAYGMPGTSGSNGASLVNSAQGIPPAIPVPIQGIDNRTYYQPFEQSSCNAPNRSNQIMSFEAGPSSGQGGCASMANKAWQKGANGKIKITCEKWQ